MSTKITFLQLKTKCRAMNPSLRDTPFGVAVDHVGTNTSVLRMPRNPADRVPFELFRGSTREVAAYLTGLDAGGALRMSITDPDEQDGSDV